MQEVVTRFNQSSSRCHWLMVLPCCPLLIVSARGGVLFLAFGWLSVRPSSIFAVNKKIFFVLTPVTHSRLKKISGIHVASFFSFGGLVLPITFLHSEYDGISRSFQPSLSLVSPFFFRIPC